MPHLLPRVEPSLVVKDQAESQRAVKSPWTGGGEVFNKYLRVRGHKKVNVYSGSF